MARWTNRFEADPELEKAYQVYAVRDNRSVAHKALLTMLAFYVAFMAHNFFNLFDSNTSFRDASIRYFELTLPTLLPMPLLFIYASRQEPGVPGALGRMQNAHLVIVFFLGVSLVLGGLHSLRDEWQQYLKNDVDSIWKLSSCADDTTVYTVSKQSSSNWEHNTLTGTMRELLELYLDRVVLPLIAANVNLIRPVAVIALAPLIRLDFVRCVVLSLLVSAGYTFVILLYKADTAQGKFVANEVLVIAAVPAISIIMLVYARQLERFQRLHFVRRKVAEDRAQRAEELKERAELQKAATTLENRLLKEKLSDRQEGTFSLDAPMTRIVTSLKRVYDDAPGLDEASRERLQEAIFSLTANSNVYQTDVAARLDGIDSDTRAWAVSLMGQDDYERLRKAGDEASAAAGGLLQLVNARVELLPSVGPVQERTLNQALAAMEVWEFDVQPFERDRPLLHTVMAAFQWHGFSEVLPISGNVAVNYFHLIDQGYRQSNPYHNAAHGADVVASMHWLMAKMNGGAVLKSLTSREVFAALVAAAIHDYSHPGRTNAYLVKTRAALAMTYSDSSVLERMHLAEAFKVSKRPGCDLFAGFSDRRYQEVRKAIVELVLITDFAAHLVIVGKLKSMIAGPPENPMFLMQVLIKISDLGHTAKTVDIHARWTARLVEEFFQQGDAERAESVVGGISPFMDREAENTPHNQIGFFQFVTVPFFEACSGVFAPPPPEAGWEAKEEDLASYHDAEDGWNRVLRHAHRNLSLWLEAQERELLTMEKITEAGIFSPSRAPPSAPSSASSAPKKNQVLPVPAPVTVEVRPPSTVVVEDLETGSGSDAV